MIMLHSSVIECNDHLQKSCWITTELWTPLNWVVLTGFPQAPWLPSWREATLKSIFSGFMHSKEGWTPAHLLKISLAETHHRFAWFLSGKKQCEFSEWFNKAVALWPFVTSCCWYMGRAAIYLIIVMCSHMSRDFQRSSPLASTFRIWCLMKCHLKFWMKYKTGYTCGLQIIYFKVFAVNYQYLKEGKEFSYLPFKNINIVGGHL